MTSTQVLIIVYIGYKVAWKPLVVDATLITCFTVLSQTFNRSFNLIFIIYLIHIIVISIYLNVKRFKSGKRLIK